MRKYAAPSRDMAILAMEAIGAPATTKELQERVCLMFGVERASVAVNALQGSGPRMTDRWRYFDEDLPSDWPMRYVLSPLGLKRAAEMRNERETAARTAEKGTDDGREHQK